MSFAIIQKKLEVIPPAKRAPLLEVARTGQIAQASRVNHEYLGILAEHLSQENARKLAETLQSIGIETQVLDMSEVVPRPQPVDVVNAEISPRGFVTRDMYLKETVVPWDSVVFLSATRVKQTTRPAVNHLSLAPTGGVRGDAHSAVGEGSWVLAIYTNGATPHYRIQQNRFNYTYLGERRTLKSFENLRLVAADIARFATQAAMGEGFKSLLAGGTARDHSTLQTFEEESRWHLQRLRERGS
jgi:hypothetical protein